MKHLKRWAPLCLTVLVVVAVAYLMHRIGLALDGAGGLALATAPIVTQVKSLPKILSELTALQNEYKGKVMPEDVATKFESLAQEAKAMQDEADRGERIKRFEKFAREVPDPDLPDGGETKGKKKIDIAGYVSPGALFAASKGLADYIANGLPAGMPSAPIEAPGLGMRLIPVTKAQREALEAKASPTLGARVIEPDRLTEVVRATENDETVLRDILNVSPTSSNAIEYVRRVSFTRAAAAVADAAAKPEAATEYDLVSVSVRTQAVWIPVTEQQLQDASEVMNLVDTDLLWDLRKLEEEQVMYGSGAGQNFLGICNDTGVVAGRTVAGDTVIDKIRRAITDVRKDSYSPNGVVLDPIDWESVVLTKGTDSHYVWVVVTDENGSRIWGLRVVESLAAEENAGNATEERNIVVGDFMRGATLWDRMQATIAVGWINDQFVKNMRTIRAEQRTAFSVKRPKAFRKIVTVVAVP